MKRWRWGMTTAAMLGLLARAPLARAEETPSSARFGPVPSTGTDSVPPAMAVRDVRMSRDGFVRGQVLDANGRPLSVELALSRPGETSPRLSRTDDAGRFAFGDVAPGVVELRIAEEAVAVRVWRTETAPPAAVEEILLVAVDGQLTRGQRPISSLFCCQPVMLGVLLAAAIAIPIAIHDSGDRPAASN